MSSEVPKIPVLGWTEPDMITSDVLDDVGEVVLHMPGQRKKDIGPFVHIRETKRMKKEEAVRRITSRALEDAEVIIERLQKFIEENKGDENE